MLDLVTDIVWVILGIVAALAIVYTLVRLGAIAWHKTKREYDTLPYSNGEYPERKRQNDEES